MSATYEAATISSMLTVTSGRDSAMNTIHRPHDAAALLEELREAKRRGLVVM